MIVEMRIYTLKPGSTAQVLDRIERALPERQTLSPLAAMWYTDVGRLDQIVHLWPFKDLAERTSVRDRFTELKHWPVNNGDDLVESESRIMRPAPFSPPLEARKLGSIYEICVDALAPHSLHQVVDSWSKSIEARMKLAPLAGAWSSEIGPLNQWTHVWAYESFEHRLEVRREAITKKIWPPEPGNTNLFRKRESMICFPASYSPLR